MSSYKPISSVSPVSAKREECPFDCIGCQYNSGFDINGEDVYVNCELEDN